MSVLYFSTEQHASAWCHVLYFGLSGCVKMTVVDVGLLFSIGVVFGILSLLFGDAVDYV